ncbi:MAG: hypothetical protein COV91_03830 [Candidatus Taylorbacteria bacterium CG11_big_fil_rev_8_21_14_0_20_46_11]|uniref:Uncharacterized protein n=1 Tax=Candidatus Taylorbacteria bacterium CG11_big_fil_rev_8_21_14_0_20_46_11 TaxID=1975025 RepID=A0A2H0KB89_9BACT|nr:MAG: hypothetical protein COV91_03830 [Candidatus Taylorbacteria bacterium CG11_big_fil_rev_8_21_14_0_20_46_11]
MEDTDEKRIEKIKELAKSYYFIDEGILIDKHLELLRVFDIKGFENIATHPHREKRVYISRKALKHFVESRRAELEKYHTEEEALKRIDFALGEIKEVVVNYHSYTRERTDDGIEKHFYARNYHSQGQPSIRILIEEKGENLEICTLHFTKNKKEG